MQLDAGSLVKPSVSGENPLGQTMPSSKRKLIIEKRIGLFDLGWSELWEYRELLYALVGRELKLRYKQTAIGVSWVLLQPLVTMVIFTVIFGEPPKNHSKNQHRHERLQQHPTHADSGLFIT